MEKLFDLPPAVLTVLTVLRAWGARTFIMGGAIADMLVGREPRDWDLEVHGMAEDQVLSALSDYRPKKVGSTFAAIRFNVNGTPIDITLPNVDPIEAARQRDLTINSPYYDPYTKELFDPFGGVEDGRQGILAATSEHYLNYPVNALRTAQFLSRGKGRSVNMQTTLFASSMAARADTIPAEQIFAQMRKLLSGTSPQRGLEFLRLTRWLYPIFPELHMLCGTPENQAWHPEGKTSWEHTLCVIENMATCLNMWPGQYSENEATQIPEEWKEALMWAALCHDLGKALTADGTGSFVGHDQAGEAPTRALLERLKAPKDLVEKTVTLVTNHMQPWTLTWGTAGDAAWRRLHNKVPLQILVWLSRADWSAHPNHEVGDWGNHKPSVAIADAITRLPAAKIPAVVQGRDLIAAGISPGPHMKTALDAAYAAQIEDTTLTKDALIAVALAALS